MKEAIYILRQMPSADDTVEGFKLDSKQPSLLGRENITSDFRRSDPDRRDSNPPSLAGVWRPQRVIGKAKAENDYPAFNFSLGIFSEKAAEGLKTFLEANGELLPVIAPSTKNSYSLYNLRTVADVLDETRSVLNRCEGKEFLCSSIEHYEFYQNRLAGLSIFKLPQVSLPIHVTQQFVNHVQELGLNGFHFLKIWPLPPGINWELQARNELYKKWGRPIPPSASAPAAQPLPGNFIVRPLNRVENENLIKAIDAYQRQFAVEAGAVTVQRILRMIDASVIKWKTSKSVDESALLDQAYLLGIAWGETLVRDLGWRWEILVKDEQEALSVVSPDKALAVPALLFFKRLMKTSDVDPTGLLTFNMIRSGQFQVQPGALRLIS